MSTACLCSILFSFLNSVSLASIFHEFIKKYQCSLEQSTSSGRILLPKPMTPRGGANVGVPTYSPGEALSPIELMAKTLFSSPNALQLVQTFPAQSTSSYAVARSPVELTGLGRASMPTTSPGESCVLPSQGSTTPCLLSPIQIPTSMTVGEVLASGLSPLPPPSSLSPRLKSPKKFRRISPAASSTGGRPIKASRPASETANTVTVAASPIPLTSPEPVAFQSSPIPLTTRATVCPHSLPGTSPPVATAIAHVDPPGSFSGTTSQPAVEVPRQGDHNGASSTKVTLTPSSFPSLPKVGAMQAGVTSPPSVPWVAHTQTSPLSTGSIPETTVSTMSLATASVRSSRSGEGAHSSPLVAHSSPPPLVSMAILGSSQSTATPPPLIPAPSPPQVSESSSLPPRTGVRKGYAKAAPPSKPSIEGGTPLAASGTLQSPTKPAQAFVNVEYFLVPSPTPGRPTGTGAGSIPGSVAMQLPSPQEIPHVSVVRPSPPLHLSPPLGVQRLPQMFRATHVAPSQPIPISKIVNQQPIPSATEHGPRRPARAIPVTLVPPTSIPSTYHPSYGVVNPNMFLANPSSAIPPNLFFSAGGASGAVYPIDSSLRLPSVSTICPRTQGKGYDVYPNYPPAVTTRSSSASELNTDGSPPKRPRLE